MSLIAMLLGNFRHHRESMKNDNVRTKDLPDDLTPFITQTTLYPEGRGGFGDVWKCDYNHDANGISALVSPCVGFHLQCNWLTIGPLIDKVAVKVFTLPERYDLEKINRKISREIGILKFLRHENIVPLWGIATGFGPSNHNDLTAPDRSRMLEDVSAGLHYLHSVRVMHGDITGANILIDKGGHARLIDFGLSTITQPLLGQSHLAATSIRPGAVRYAAPELVLLDDCFILQTPVVDRLTILLMMHRMISPELPRTVVPMTQIRPEQPPDSPPLHPDHELKALTTVADNLSASTSSTPAFSLPDFAVFPSIGFAGSSTAAAHGRILSMKCFSAVGMLVTGYIATP
ncbi:kinase-like domain-containing protein [Suillus subalutaceus]|uniref:kinase-like domain-containing protein n=1 Tax=Suillus subalutaceus TaxID=48586 RepID=UPI001B86F3E2|nr:kinase-like domain-containing protein [Suillus subalutaceus]KAG1842853.1 kinase-like domain-containing protein [Suillus subalutaceus]